MTIRTVSSEEARLNWRSTLDTASQGGAVIIERHGKTSAVVIGPEEWYKLRDAHLKELQRRAEESETVSWDEVKAGLVERGLID